ncbi:hypothetical protein QBC40DRAFT_290176 [Triangularia verruculosa]|uniref:A-kinase anchor protein 7-like phosphoesterase domain-containing protein n=1 Tax=Triangularia verruculosa TaxID=2587418 RepID=A0AAN6X625_9PEZI|nr:hypothetical protein QBC40DRAFT_290176 [Triangularia verruculosa]
MPPKPKPPPPTHFLCIPLVTPISRPQLASSLSAFQEEVTLPPPQGFSLPETAIRPLGTLHLTLGIFSFPPAPAAPSPLVNVSSGESTPKEDRLEKAKSVLASLNLKEIWSSVKKDSDGDQPSITLKGLASMHPLPKTTVLYAPPTDETFTGSLQRFCEGVRDNFLQQKEGEEQGEKLMVEDNRPLLLHATIVNTIYVKGRDKQRHRGKHGKERMVVDRAGDIIERYEDQIWMKDVMVEKVAICKMGAKKLIDERGEETGEEEYEVVGEVAF